MKKTIARLWYIAFAIVWNGRIVALASEMFPYGRLRLSAEHNLKRRPSYYAETKLKLMPFYPSRRGGGSSSCLLHAVTVTTKLIKSDKINS